MLSKIKRIIVRMFCGQKVTLDEHETGYEDLPRPKHDEIWRYFRKD